MNGFVEVLSTEFAGGWTEMVNGHPAHLSATIDGDVVGIGRADQRRPDLERPTGEPGAERRAFLILFDKPIPKDKVAEIRVQSVNGGFPVARSNRARIDAALPRQIFVLGSPRSGTSAVGYAVSSVLNLAWFGECHAAPVFAKAADILAGDPEHLNDFPRFMAQHDFRKYVIDRARFAYYTLHGSVSFVDKTPGSEMIESAAFISEAFPAAKFIYVQRNGISNVLSRMVKFGGIFHEHCEDWANAVNSWLRIRDRLPHFLELQQEEIMDSPLLAANRVALYLGREECASGLCDALMIKDRERTGAGIDRTTLRDTGWSIDQINEFKQICGSTMQRAGYLV